MPSTPHNPHSLCNLKLKHRPKTTPSWQQLSLQLRILSMHFQQVPSTSPPNNLLHRTISSNLTCITSSRMRVTRTSSTSKSSMPSSSLSFNNSRPLLLRNQTKGSVQGWTPSQRRSRTVTRNQPLDSSKTPTQEETCSSSSGRLVLRSNNNSSRVTLHSISTSECWYLKYSIEPKA